MPDKLICEGLDGNPDDNVTVGKFNRWFSIYMRVNVMPQSERIALTREAVQRIEEKLLQHIQDEESLLRKVLVVCLLTLLGVCVSLIVYIWRVHVD